MVNKNRQFPHLLSEDIEVLEQYLALHAKDYTSLEYDVRVGEGRDPGPDLDNKYRRMALDLSQRRIDVVARTKKLVTIIEVTHSAGFRAIGQCLGYPILYARTFRVYTPIARLLVAGSLQSDVQPMLEGLEIPYWLPGMD